MTLVKLSQICNMQSGGTPRRGSSEYYGGDIPWIKISDFKDSTGSVISETEETITREGLKSINNRLFEKGTLLLAMYGSIGKTAFTGIQASCNQAILGITAKDENQLNLKYLKYWFDLNQGHLVNQGRGVTLNNISLNIVKKQEIDLPDLETQNKIVAILDKANTLVQKRQQTIDLLKDLLDAQFYFSFGEPYQNPFQWPTKLLNEITLSIKSGWSIGGDQRQKNDNELGVLKVSAVTSGIFKPEEHKAVQKENITRELVTPKKGDLLFSRANTIELVGATCIVDKDYDDLFLPDKLWRIDVDESIITKEYFKAVLTSPIYRKNFVRTATGSSGSMLNISQVKFKSAKIPIPSIETQRKYSELFWKIHEQTEILLKSSQEINVLLSSILQRAFSGNLDFDVKTELDVLLEEIDLQKSENDLYSILSNEEYVNSLVERLNKQDFENQDLYDKAKHAAFQILKTDEILAQKYDEDIKSLKLVVK